MSLGDRCRRPPTGAEAAPDPDADAYHTVGGFVMQRLGRVPAAGDAFEWQGRRFEVVDMDGHRVDKVLIAPAPDTPRSAACRMSCPRRIATAKVRSPRG